jgi:AraC-like DNA-binding protein
VLRGATAALFLLLTLLFARDVPRSRTATLGVMLALSGIAYLAMPALPPGYLQTWWMVPIQLASLAGPGLFWLFASSWFDDDFALRGYHVGAVGLLVLLGAGLNYGFGEVSDRLWPLGLAWRAVGVAMILLGILVSLRGRASDLIESRRRLRFLLSLSIGLVSLWVVLAELPLSAWPPPLGWRLVNAASLLLLATTLATGTMGWRDSALLAPPLRPSVLRPEADDTQLLIRLDADMTRERLYRRDGLTITAVAARLGVPEYRLRRAINQGLGARNFNAYLNGFRLRETAEALSDPQQRDVPILTIALDAGFGSLAPFNRAFRAEHGCTPSAYRARH